MSFVLSGRLHTVMLLPSIESLFFKFQSKYNILWMLHLYLLLELRAHFSRILQLMLLKRIVHLFPLKHYSTKAVWFTKIFHSWFLDIKCSITIPQPMLTSFYQCSRISPLAPCPGLNFPPSWQISFQFQLLKFGSQDFNGLAI